MNAIDLLKNDHDYVDMLFGRIEATPPSRHAAIFKQIEGELKTHAHIEEAIFYPEAKKQGNKELKDTVMESLEEHRQMKMFLAEIVKSRSTDKREAMLKVLIEDTRHHVKEEENEMFPLVEDKLNSDQLEELGERMEAEKLKFQRSNRIPQRREEPQGALTKVVEKAKAVVASVMPGMSEDSPKRAKGRGKKASADAKPRKTTPKSANSKTAASSSKSSTSKSGRAATNGKSKTSGGSSKSKASTSSRSVKRTSSASAKTRGSRASASR